MKILCYVILYITTKVLYFKVKLYFSCFVSETSEVLQTVSFELGSTVLRRLTELTHIQCLPHQQALLIALY